MRILLVDTFYPAFVTSFYRANPQLREEAYAVQWRALMDSFFAKSDAYSYYLQEAGHEAHEIVVDVPPLQAAWAREHGLRVPFTRFRRSRVLERVVEAQIEDFRPDVLYVQNLSVLHPRLLSRHSGRMLVAGQNASELPPEPQLRAFSLILTSFPHYVGRLRTLGINSEYLRLAFDPRVLERIAPGERDLGIVFVGALGRTQHTRGNALLAAAADQLPLQLWGRAIEQQPPDSPLRRVYRGEAWGLDMLRLLARAQIVLNRHIDVAEGHANNMRLYEATGMGALLLTDGGRNLRDLFEPGREVVTYRDEGELLELATYYLDHDEERSAIATAGQARTLREHTYAHRMRELAEILQRYAS